MNIISSPLPFWTVVIPLLAVPLAAMFEDKRSGRLAAVACLMSFLCALSMYPQVSNGKTLTTIVDTGFVIKFVFMADPLSLLAGLVASLVWTLVSFYAVGYMAHEHAQRRYNVFSLLSMAGMMGVVFTRNLFTLYIFFELLSVASYVMVIHEQTPEALKAGLKYIFMGICGGLVLLMSIVATQAIAGTTDLVELASGAAAPLRHHPLVGLIFLGYVFGFGVKAGIFPVHVWLPEAHPVAPSPASALLSGVMIKAGAYGIIRAVYSIVGVETLLHQPVIITLLVIGFLNMFLGSAMAIKQTELKRLLAYSSVAQMGYIIIGIALLTPSSIAGAAAHIFNHALMKSTLFLCAGAFIHQTGLRNLVDLKGIGKRMPVTTFCFTLAALSMIGFPPFVGFISKWFLATGGLQVSQAGSYSNGLGMFTLGMLILSSLMNLIYYGPIIYGAWFGGGDAHADASHHGGDHHEAAHAEAVKLDDPDRWMLVPLMVLGACTVIFGIFPQLPSHLAHQFSLLYFH